MGRRARLDQTDSLHHVMARTVERRLLFMDDTDRAAFLDTLSQLCAVSETGLLAWALMDSHVHLLIRCGDFPLSRFMQQLLSRYAKYFNRRHGRTGHLFESRFRSILINDEAYLTTVVRYIHLNPVVAGMVDSVDDLARYPWTGHRSIISGISINGQDTKAVLSMFGSDRESALAAYLKMMSSDSPAWEYVGEGFILGSRGMSAGRVSDLMSERTPSSRRVLGDRKSTAELATSLKADGRHGIRDRDSSREIIEGIFRDILDQFGLERRDLMKKSRNGTLTAARAAAARRLITEAGLNMTETGRLLGITRQGVSYLLNCK